LTTHKLHAELERFEAELRAAGLKKSTVETYIDSARRFIRWLDDDYSPTGPR
jgi:hypothetical protein